MTATGATGIESPWFDFERDASLKSESHPGEVHPSAAARPNDLAGCQQGWSRGQDIDLDTGRRQPLMLCLWVPFSSLEAQQASSELVERHGHGHVEIARLTWKVDLTGKGARPDQAESGISPEFRKLPKSLRPARREGAHPIWPRNRVRISAAASSARSSPSTRSSV